jgi:O-antigen/teichoic acid export membrane protein
MQSASQRVVMNTGILYARMAITVLLSLYTTRVTLLALGAEDFGIFNVVGGAVAMLTFLNTSLAAATQRFMSFAHGQDDTSRQSQIFNVSVLLHAAIALVLVVILEVAGVVLFGTVLQIAPERLDAAWMVYQFTVVSTLFTVIAVPYDAVITARENMLLFAVLGVVEAVLKLGIAFAITVTGSDKLMLYGLLTAILTIGLFALRAAHCHVRYQECALAPRKTFDKPLFREMTSFAGWSFLGSSTSMVANYGQGIVLNMFFGTVVNAAQGIAGQVSGQLGAFAGTMLRALNPMITKSEGAGNRALMVKASVMGSKVSFLLLMVLYVPVLVEMPYIFKLWLNDVPEYAVIFCRLLLIRNLIEQMYLTLISSISAVGAIRGFQIVTSLLNIVPLAMSYALFAIGLPPAALYLAFLAYSVLTFAVVLIFSRVKFAIRIGDYLMSVTVRCSMAFAMCLCIAYLPLLFMPENFLRLLSVVLLSLGSCFPSVWYVIFSKGDRADCLDLFAIMIRRVRTKFSDSRYCGLRP